MQDHDLTIRAATTRDSDALARLAGLDSRPQLRGNSLVAVDDGTAIAAIALSSGSIVTDPFHATDDAVRQLRLRRYRLVAQVGEVGPVRILLRRMAPQPC